MKSPFNFKKTLLITLFLVFLAAGAYTGGPTGWQPPLIQGDEVYVYDIKWMGIPVANGRIMVDHDFDLNGKEVLAVQAEGRTNKIAALIYPVRDRYVSYVDKETNTILRSEEIRREGTYVKDAKTDFDHKTGTAFYQHFPPVGTKKEYKVNSSTFDLVSLFYLIRHEDIELNQPKDFELLFSEDVFHFKGIAKKRKKVKMFNGKYQEVFEAVPLKIINKDGDFDEGTGRILVTDDAYKVFVKAELKAPLFSKLTAELVSASIYQEEAAA